MREHLSEGVHAQADTQTDENRNPGTRAALAGIMVILVISVISAGCAKDAADQQLESEEKGPAISKKYERGPMTLLLEIDKDEITIADQLQLTLEARVDEGYEVEMPRFGENLEQFGIVDFREPPPKLIEGGKVVVSRRYTLEPFLSGEYKIPPMTVKFRQETPETPAENDKTASVTPDKGDGDGDGEAREWHKVETEEVTVTVTSLLPKDYEQLDIRPIAPPVSMPKQARLYLYLGIGGGALLLVALAVGLYWYFRRSSLEDIAARTPPDEAAFDALEKLVADQLIEQGKFKAFFVRIADILRRYIENRFGLHAPERTTEEFLEELKGSKALNSTHKKMLREFLGHCDMVKFAEYRPSSDEIQRAFDLCKQFILETRQAQGQPTPRQAGPQAAVAGGA